MHAKMGSYWSCIYMERREAYIYIQETSMVVAVVALEKEEGWVQVAMVRRDYNMVGKV